MIDCTPWVDVTETTLWTTVDVVLHNQIKKTPIEERVLHHNKMNVFVLSEEPSEAGQMLHDAHVRRACLDYPSHLINVHIALGKLKGFKPRRPNHPVSLWAADSVCNYQWLLALTETVWAEYKYRFTSGSSEHKCAQYLRGFVTQLPGGIPTFSTVPTPPPQCLPDDYVVPQTTAHANRWRNAISAYREYYVQDQYRATWTKREMPEWFRDGTLRAELDALTTRMDEPGPVHRVPKLFKEIRDDA